MKSAGDCLDNATHLCHSTAMPAFAESRSTLHLDGLLSRPREGAVLKRGYGSPALSSILNAQQICMKACVVAGVCGAFGH